MDLLESMRTLLLVAEHGGFTKAARRLRQAPSTVTRVVSALEEEVGVRLLDRTTRSVHLTDAGARYLEHVRPILAAVQEAERAAQAQRSESLGSLRITAPVLFGRLHLVPLLTRFLARHPRVTVELELLDRVVSLVEEGFDLALRIGALPDSSLVAVRVGSTRRVVVGSPAYLAARGRPSHPRELASHDLVGFGALSASQGWRFQIKGAVQELRLDNAPRFTSNNAAASIEHALGGGGLVMVLGYQVAEAVRAGALEVVLANFEPPPLPIHLVHASARLLPAKVRALVELVRASAAWDFVSLDAPTTPKRRTSGARPPARTRSRKRSE